MVKDKVINTFNAKLKGRVKNEIKKDILFNKGNKNTDDDNNIDFSYDISQNLKVKEIGRGVIHKIPKKWLLIGVAIVLLSIIIMAAISAMVSILAIGDNAAPNIDKENKVKIIKLMEDLDNSCSKKLISNFTLEGDNETDWRTVLALTLGYYKNDLSTFDEKVQTNVSLGSGNYAELVTHYAEVNNLDPYIVCGVIMKESTWDPNAGSPVGAVGLMQLMEATAIENGCFNRYDPEQNISAGCKYLKKCYDYFDGNERLALAGYNAGCGNAEEYINTVPETMEYVPKVLEYAEQYRRGELKIPNSGNNGSDVIVQSNKGQMQQIYDLVNVVLADHSKLNRKSFEEVIHQLEFDDDQKAVAYALYEGDVWSDIFGEDYDFSFKINGSYSSNGNSGNVTLINGERKGNQTIIDLAMGELGNNGDKYTDWYGLSRGTPYCNIFVTWLMYNTSDNLYNGQYPSKAECNDAYTVATSEWFMSKGRWGNRDYDKLVSGDVIYFDWDGGGVDHVGIVKAVDNDWIYTIEGNSINGLVCANKYRRGSNVIYGFGLMNY